MVIGTCLSGCATTGGIALSIKGACDAFRAPAVPIKGKTKPDQLWVDDTTESGVAACGWKRPKAPAPAKIQKVKVAAQVEPAPAVVPEIVTMPETPKAPKLSLWQHFKLYWFGIK